MPPWIAILGLERQALSTEKTVMVGLQLIRFLSVCGTFLVGFWLPVRLIGYAPAPAVEIFFDLTISAVAALNIYLHFASAESSPRRLSSWLRPGLMLDLPPAILADRPGLDLGQCALDSTF